MDKRFPSITSIGMLNYSTPHFREVGLAAVSEVEAIDVTIRAFNLGVQGMFSQGHADGMAMYCSADWLVEMRRKYAAWRQQGIQQLNLVTCRFLGADIPSELDAMAFAYEHWCFVYEDGSERFTTGSIDQYYLSKDSGTWLVEKVVFFHKDE
jgi:hypothetical protein